MIRALCIRGTMGTDHREQIAAAARGEQVLPIAVCAPAPTLGLWEHLLGYGEDVITLTPQRHARPGVAGHCGFFICERPSMNRRTKQFQAMYDTARLASGGLIIDALAYPWASEDWLIARKIAYDLDLKIVASRHGEPVRRWPEITFRSDLPAILLGGDPGPVGCMLQGNRR